MQIVFSGDDLHEMSNPVLVEIEKNITTLSSAEVAKRVLKLMYFFFFFFELLDLII